jgi:HEAT repeat protein
MGQAETHEAHRRRDVEALIKQLRGGEAETRSLAAYYLGRLRSPEAVPSDEVDASGERVAFVA